MKILILSDIHNDYETLYKIVNNETFDKLIVLGDLFSYGFYSNVLNENNIIKLLKNNKNKLLLIKGNCDYNIDYEKINLHAYEILTIPLNDKYITITHGNKYYKENMPNYYGDIFISGHTHIPSLTKEKNIIYANPGSIGNPRFNTKKSYIIFIDNKLILKTVDNEIIKEMDII